MESCARYVKYPCFLHSPDSLAQPSWLYSSSKAEFSDGQTCPCNTYEQLPLLCTAEPSANTYNALSQCHVRHLC